MIQTRSGRTVQDIPGKIRSRKLLERPTSSQERRRDPISAAASDAHKSITCSIKEPENAILGFSSQLKDSRNVMKKLERRRRKFQRRKN